MRGAIEISQSSTGYIESFDSPDQLVKAGETLLHGPQELWAVSVDGFDSEYLNQHIMNTGTALPSPTELDLIYEVIPALTDLKETTYNWCLQQTPACQPAALNMYLKTGSIGLHFDEDNLYENALYGPLTGSLRLDSLGNDKRTFYVAGTGTCLINPDGSIDRNEQAAMASLVESSSSDPIPMLAIQHIEFVRLLTY